MKIAVAADHGGYRLKKAVVNMLEKQGHEITDFGTDTSESVDYPIYAQKVCQEVKDGGAECGILVCGTGIGMSLAANKIKGIRAAHVTDCFSAEMARKHNDANVLCLGERITGEGLAFMITDLFVNTEFEGGRHRRRVDLVMDLEK